MSRRSRERLLRSFLTSTSGQESIGDDLLNDLIDGSGMESGEQDELAELFKRVQAQESSAEVLDGLEAIILPKVRPVTTVVDGSYKHWKVPSLWSVLDDDTVRANLEAAIPAIGRVDVPGRRPPYAGTGFVVGRNLLMTNRHVAVGFARGLGVDRLTYRPGRTAAVDFLHEDGRDGTRSFAIRRIAMIHPFWDMALLEIEGLEGVDPLTLATEDPRDSDWDQLDIVVVGYPAKDRRGNQEVQRDVFGDTFEIKRLQPGKLRGGRRKTSYDHRVKAVTHDASTLGGNSGSAVLDLDGRVVGLHFAGVYLDTNYAVPMSELLADPVVRALGVGPGVRTATVALSTLPHWRRYVTADRLAELQAALPAAPAPEERGGLGAVAPPDEPVEPDDDPPSDPQGPPPDAPEPDPEPDPEPEPQSPPPDAQSPDPSGVAVDVTGAPADRVSTSIDVAGDGSTVTVTVHVDLPDALLALLDGEPGQATESPAGEVSEHRIAPDPDYNLRTGYDPAFLGEDRVVPLPVLPPDVAADATPNGWDPEGSPVLDYTNFSVVMSRSRRLALYSATNIAGAKRGDVPRSLFSDRWVFDPRIPREAQWDNRLYKYNRLDRGHVTRRLDAAWGDTWEHLLSGHDDTFHWTNCTPQHEQFNRNDSTWGGIEEYILDNAEHHDQRVTVFTGPVFRPDDPIYTTSEGDRVRLPLEYWKIVVTLDTRGELVATGYLLSQSSLVATLVDEETFEYGDFEGFQVTIATIEDLTALDFGGLRDVDPFAGRATESLDARAPLGSPGEAVLVVQDPTLHGVAVEGVYAELSADSAAAAGDAAWDGLPQGAGWTVGDTDDLGDGSWGVVLVAPEGVAVSTAWDAAYAVAAATDGFAEPLLATRFDAATPPAPVDSTESMSGRLRDDWNLRLVNARAAWDVLSDAGKGLGAGVRIGHVDTGITDHPEVWKGQGASFDKDAWLNLLEPGTPPWDARDGGFTPAHGTATASLVVSPAGPQGDHDGAWGLAPDATLVVVRATTSVVVLASMTRLSTAIRHLVDAGCHVITISLGGLPSRRLKRACEYAESKGVILCAAAGNYVQVPVWPANYATTVGCAACGPGGKAWAWSSKGPTIDVTAPAHDVFVAKWDDDGKTSTVVQSSGTSYAAPTVAAGAALWLSHHGIDALKARYPGSDLPRAFKRVLQDAGFEPVDSHLPGWGAGVIDYAKLLAADLPDLSTESIETELGPLAIAAGDEDDADALRFRFRPGRGEESTGDEADTTLEAELAFHLLTDRRFRTAVLDDAGRPTAPDGASTAFRALFTSGG